MPAGAALPGASAIVDHDRPCVRCSYNLRGAWVGGACPECGEAVASSLRGELLQHSSAEYLRTLLRGLRFVLNGLLAMVLVITASIVASVLRAGPGVQLLLAIAQVLVSGAILLGYWLLTTPDPRYVGSTEAPDTARRVVRVAVVVQVAGLALSIPLLMLGGVGTGGMGGPAGGRAGAVVLLALYFGAQAIAMLAWLAQFLGAMTYTAWLGGRVPDVWLVNRARRYRWLLPVVAVVFFLVFLLGPLVALVMYWNLLNRLSQHVKSILEKGHPESLKGMV